MRIGILTPSIYMYKKRFSDRIFAPSELVRHLVNGLMAKGHEMYWFTAPEESSATIESGDVDLLEKDLQIRTMQDITPEIKDKMSLYARKYYYEMDLIGRAFGMAKSGQLDVLHSYHTTLYSAHFFEELTGFPVLYTLHDMVPTDDMLEAWLFNKFSSHRYLSISLSQRGKYKEHFFDNVYHGIDTDEFAFSANAGSGLITVGRMTAEKGFHNSIKVAQNIGQKLTIASWINDNVKKSEYYQKQISPHIDNQLVTVNSLLTGSDRIKFYQNAKAFLFPIEWEEPFGMVMLEAMSCGTPVIAYNRGSVSEIVKDGITGFIIEPSGPAARQPQNQPTGGHPAFGAPRLASPDDKTIPWVIKKQGIEGLVEAVRRIGEIDRRACRKHIEENFSLEKMVEGYERVYRKILDTKTVRQ